MVKVVLIRGDGIGPEISEAALAMIAATGVDIEWVEAQAGAAAIDAVGDPLPRETIELVRQHRFALKGPLMTPVGGGYRSVNVALRQELDLFANVRPVKSFEGVNAPFKNCDMVVFRENTQGFYTGVEHYIGPGKDAAQAISLITRHASERIIRFAFEYARANKRRKVTLVHKANILKLTTGLFLQIGKEIAAQYPDIQFDDRIIDAMAMQLVLKPHQFDIIVTTNLFGDVLSDLTAGLIGGLGLAPAGNYGEEQVAIFEAVHGTAPDIAGKGLANPTALTLSGAMMLRKLGWLEQGDRLEAAVRGVIAEGKETTPDLGGTGTTRSFADAVVARLRG
jgi:isocitrate dehydrogenase (NAD+)